MSKDNQHLFESALAMTIHDIKNSLALLLDNLEGKNGAIVAGGGGQYEIRRINNNLVRLLGLYKIGANHYIPQFDYYTVVDLLEEVASDYHDMLEHRHLELEVDCDDELQGKFDKQLMYSVIENAVNNASRYSKSKIRVVARVEECWLMLTVEDDGDGFPDTLLEFNEAMAKEQPFNASSGTTGLGFYFASVVAKQHNLNELSGYIKLNNGGSLGGGQFTIGLPTAMDTALVFDFL